MAYELNPTNMNPLMQKFPVEADAFEGLLPKVEEPKIGLPEEEVVVTPFDCLNNGDVQLETVDVVEIAMRDGFATEA